MCFFLLIRSGRKLSNGCLDVHAHKQMSISPTFKEQLLSGFPFAKKLQTQTESTEKLSKTFAYKNAARM